MVSTGASTAARGNCTTSWCPLVHPQRLEETARHHVAEQKAQRRLVTESRESGEEKSAGVTLPIVTELLPTDDVLLVAPQGKNRNPALVDAVALDPNLTGAAAVREQLFKHIRKLARLRGTNPRSPTPGHGSG